MCALRSGVGYGTSLDYSEDDKQADVVQIVKEVLVSAYVYACSRLLPLTRTLWPLPACPLHDPLPLDSRSQLPQPALAPTPSHLPRLPLGLTCYRHARGARLLPRALGTARPDPPLPLADAARARVAASKLGEPSGHR